VLLQEAVKIFELRYVRLQFLPQSVDRWNVHSYRLIPVSCGYDVIVIYNITDYEMETIRSISSKSKEGESC